MVRLTPHDSSVMTALAQYSNPSDQRKQELLDDLKSTEARLVGEAYLDPQKYDQAPDYVRATVDYLRKWVENNKRLRLNREARQRSSRAG
jgi:hypothetical protein